MSDQTAKSLLKVGETPIHTDDVLKYMKVDGSFVSARTNVLMNDVICAKAEELGLSATDEDLQVEADSRRRALGLHSKAAFEHYLTMLGITVDEWLASLEESVLRNKFRSAMGNEIFMGDASDRLKYHRGYRRMLGGAIRVRAEAHGISVTDDEVQKEADLRRRGLGLHKAADLELLLTVLKASLDEWEYELETDVLVRKLGEKNIQPLLQAEIAIALRATRALDELLMVKIMGELVRVEAKKKGIRITEEEMQAGSDQLRRALGLHTKKAFDLRLQALEFTIDDWADEVETKLLQKKLTAKDTPLIDEDRILKRIKAGFDFHKAVAGAIERALIRAKAAAKGISVSDADLQTESDSYRRALGLHSSKELKAHFAAWDIDVDTWEIFLEDRCLMRALRAQVVTDDDITKALDKDMRRITRDNLFNKWKLEQMSEADINWF